MRVIIVDNNQFVNCVEDVNQVKFSKDKLIMELPNVQFKSVVLDEIASIGCQDISLDKVADLEAKLAEYEKELMDNEKCFTEKDVEGLIKDREETIKFLKQQLAEKEEAIKLATRIANVACKPPLTIEELKKESKKQFQDKIEFAVEQLTQAIKNIKKCNYKDFGIMYQSDAIAVIDNQIKQLKEGK